MGNRKLPFGYQMELGIEVIHPEEAEKALRQLSGRPPTAPIVAQVLLLLNSLIRDAKDIQEPEQPNQADATTCRRELDQILTQLPVDEDRANALARRSAVLHYQTIGPGEYETERLKRRRHRSE